MRKTVYCSDVDGTLARQGYYLTEDTLELVHKMVDKDIWFTVCSGRFLSRTLPVMEACKLKIPGICLSGALAYDCAERKILKVFPIEKEVSELVLEKLQSLDHNCLATVYRPEENRCMLAFTREPKAQPFPMDKKNELGYLHDEIVVQDDLRPLLNDSQALLIDMAGDEVTMKTAYNMVKDLPKINVYLHESPHNKGLWVLDIVSDKSGKGNALLWLKEYLGAEEAYGFGDHYNDLPMLLAADVGVAMEEAPEDMKAKVDMVLPASPNCVPDFIMARELKEQ